MLEQKLNKASRLYGQRLVNVSGEWAHLALTPVTRSYEPLWSE
jgi:hypothetical protein